MPTDAPDGNINAYVVRPAKGRKAKAADVTTVDIAPEPAPATVEEPTEAKPVAKPVASKVTKASKK